ncbi:MAG: O-antigen ligase family protein [Bacteroidales bacterium]
MDLINIALAKRQQFHSMVYFVGLCLLAASLPTSIFMVSFSQLFLGGNWILEGRYKTKLKRFFNNKIALVFILIYAIHIIGLLWTDDLNYALGSDLKHKLPTLTLTFIIISSPQLSLKQVRIILFLFIAAVLAVSFISFFNYLINDISNPRKILLFSYHLYFNQMLVLSMFMLPYLTMKITKKRIWLAVSLVLSLWMLYFLVLTRALSALVSLSGVIVFLAFWLIFKHKNIIVKITTALLLIGSAVAITLVVSYINSLETKKTEIDFSKLDTHSKEGTAYTHITEEKLRENGNPAYIYIAEKELREAWNKRSKIDYDSTDGRGNDIRFTLFRFMASKGLRKDKEHLGKLSDEDIQAIEKGKTNYLYTKWPGIFERIHQTVRGVHMYMETKNPHWSTLTQRIDLWRASWVAFKKYPLFGWGTGDIYTAVEYGLQKNDSVLQGENMKPHNQYLVFLLTLGIVGLVLFLVFYFYTVIKSGGYKFFPFKVFMVAFFVDMLGNNPIDAQLGQTMFVLFTVIFCFVYPKDELDSYSKAQK